MADEASRATQGCQVCGATDDQSCGHGPRSTPNSETLEQTFERRITALEAEVTELKRRVANIGVHLVG